MGDDAYEWALLEGARQIRVVHVHKTTEDENSIRCSIQATSISDPCRYRTMSYAWGPTYADGSHLTKIIYCDDHPMRITANLYAALERVRDDQISWYRKLPVWIDAISINQKDPAEKANQVLMVSEIFEKSRQLTIWLGEPTDDHEASICTELGEKFWDWETNGTDIQISEHEKSTLRTILDRWWFRRRWIIQEVLVSNAAGRTPFFRIGHTGWNWPFLVYITEQLGRNSGNATDRFLALARRATNDTTVVSSVATVRARSILGSSTRPMYNTLLETLHIFDYAECYDPRDRIFALLSIGWGLTDSERFFVDYEASVETIYTRFATSFLKTRLDDFLVPLLAAASCRGLDPGTESSLPSWVPDWRRPIFYGNDKHRLAVETCLTRWCGAHHRRHRSVVSDGILVLRCWLLHPRSCQLQNLHARVRNTLDDLQSTTCRHSKGTNEPECDQCNEAVRIMQNLLVETGNKSTNYSLCLFPSSNVGFALHPKQGEGGTYSESFLLGHCFLVHNFSDMLSVYISPLLNLEALVDVHIR